MQTLKDLRQEALRDACIFKLKEQNEGVMRIFRTLDISVKVAVNFMSQPTVLRAKDLSLHKHMLMKMMEYGVAGKRK